MVEYWGHILGVRIEYDMRRGSVYSSADLILPIFDKNRTGHLMSRMVNDLQRLQNFAHHGPEDLFLSLNANRFLLCANKNRMAAGLNGICIYSCNGIWY